MALKSYAGATLGRGSGWECPECGAPNASPRGSQCVSCGFPPDGTLAGDVTPTAEPASPLGQTPTPVTPTPQGDRELMVRRFKLIEYYGPAEWVEHTLTNSLSGAYAMGDKGGYLIGTEVPEEGINNSVQLLQAITTARQTEATWRAQEWQDRQSGAPEPPAPNPAVSAFQKTMAQMGDVMAKDPRYTKTIADALTAFYTRTPETDITAEHLTQEEVENLVAVLETLTKGMQAA
jgi:hypothetical protein